MKLRCKHQAFQAEAARNVVRAFQGQPFHDGLIYTQDEGLARDEDGIFHTEVVQGFCNAPLSLDRDLITENVRALQIEQGLRPIEGLEGEGIHLTVEMETGTGKTYTYIKTMYELNKHYGWTKFIVVVPSVAIREGVYKSFTTMADHFAQEYDGKRISCFVYNSNQLSKIDTFAGDNQMHVMIINMQAFNSSFNEAKNKVGTGGNKSARIIFDERDEFSSRRPIDVLANTNPIMIIDEPQTVLGKEAKNATRKGLKHFNPLFTILYSATHREVLNMVYRLDAIDAYNKKLVKKIEVKGIHQVGSTATNGYIYLDEIVVQIGKDPQARLSFDTLGRDGTVRRQTKLVGKDFDLYEQSGKLAEYEQNYVVKEIDGWAGTVTLRNGQELHEGDAVGNVTEDTMRRIQIRETIKSHIERERHLYPRGIKVLSLFFIDRVENYRIYGEGGVSQGKFAEMFEEEYKRVVEEMQSTFTQEYKEYLSHCSGEKAHNGYFSQDKKTGKSPKEGKEKSNDESNDESAYNLIMKDKERLLSLDQPTRFIFSHSALREGWDNPNVFQICTLKDTDNKISKRQEVGRGMRLCVNQHGERQDASVLGSSGVFDVNILTIIASESYEKFSTQLQHEISEVVSSRPVVITPTLFVDHVYETSEGAKIKITEDASRKIYNKLIRQDYIDDDGYFTETYHEAKRNDNLDLGDEFKAILPGIVQTLDSVFDLKKTIDDSRKPKVANFNEENFKKAQFQELWKRIKIKTCYKVDFETAELISKAIDALDKRLSVTEIRMVVEEGVMEAIRDKEQLEAGEAMKQTKAKSYDVRETVGTGVKYDLIGCLVMETGLKRETLVSILKDIRPETFAQFRKNPEEFIRKTANIINDEKAMAVVQKISYEPTDNTYDVEIFTESTLRGKIDNAIKSTKSLYDLVVVDSDVEKEFAKDLEKYDQVAVYTKLPKGFYINTPMGHYNPDWAITFNEDKVKHIYFIAETKGNEWQRSQLRGAEEAKLECAARHFEAISQGGSNIVYGVVKDYSTLWDKVIKQADGDL